jgi:hypothetical protein
VNGSQCRDDDELTAAGPFERLTMSKSSNGKLSLLHIGAGATRSHFKNYVTLRQSASERLRTPTSSNVKRPTRALRSVRECRTDFTPQTNTVCVAVSIDASMTQSTLSTAESKEGAPVARATREKERKPR